MSLKQTEEITIWVFKDGKKGHEKQSQALIDEINKHRKVHVKEFSVIEKAEDQSIPNLIIGAGRWTHDCILAAKSQHPSAISIVLMKPGIKPTQWFDYAIVPDMDKFYFHKPNNVITTKGVLSKYSTQDTQEGTGLIVIGGPSRHYRFTGGDQKILMQQIEWLINDEFKHLKWKITTSPRSPDFNKPKHSNNVEFFNWKETKPEWLSEEISKSEVTFITPESVSTLYESLSTKTKVYVFDMPLNSDNNGKIRTKVTRNIDKLKKSKEIGFINTTKKFFSSVVESIELSNPENNNPLSEVKRVAELLLEEL